MNILDLITPTIEGRKSSISFSENKRRYTANNPKRKKVYEYHKLDTKEYFHNQPCVDYAIYLDGEYALYLIELKGSDIEHAYHQVIETAKKIVRDTDLTHPQIHGRIVLANVRRPALKSNKLKMLQRECEQLHLETRHKSQKMEEKI